MVFFQGNQIYFQEFTDFLIEICTATCLSGSETYDYAAAYFDNWGSLRKFCLHEGIGNRYTVSSPHTPQPFHISFPSRLSATVST